MEATVLADRYELGHMLGTGVDNATCVYQGWDRVLSRPVAIKILSDVNGDGPALAERFRADVGIAGRLEHHNLVRAYDAGTDGGVAYIVMELIQGRSLRERLEDGPLTPAQATAVGVAVSSALAVAHANRLRHAGIGPGDIMLLPDGQVKVLNISLTGGAREVLASKAGADLANGHHQSADGDANRADLYALGCCVYEMLTGTAPFAGERTEADDPPPLNRALAGEGAAEVTPDASGDAPDALNVPEVLETIVMRALAADPADRFQTADELRAAFESARTHIAGLTPPGGTPARAELLATNAAVPVPVPMPLPVAVPGPASRGIVARRVAALARAFGSWLQPLRGGLTGTPLDALVGRIATSIATRWSGVAIVVPVATAVLLIATVWGAVGVMRMPEVASAYQALPMQWIRGPGLWLEDTAPQAQPVGSPAAKGTSKPPVKESTPPPAGARRMVVHGMIGVDADRASFLLGGLGLRVTSYTVLACPVREKGKVVTQSPPGGSVVLEGSTVQLGVCRSKPPATSSPPSRPPSAPPTSPPSGPTAPPAPTATRPAPTATEPQPAPATTDPPPSPTTTQPPPTTTEPPPAPTTTEPPPDPTTAPAPTEPPPAP